MGFLHKLWDETLAGPAPDSGLRKLRKFNSLSAARTTATRPQPLDDTPPPIGISRSITVLRGEPIWNLNASGDASPSTPSSPVGSSAPSSPFSPITPRGNGKKVTRGKAVQNPDWEYKTGYDWIVLHSALDH